MDVRRISQLLALSLIVMRQTVSATVVEGPITIQVSGHVFYLIAPESWSAAQTEAQGLGGHLATVRSSFENNWLVTNLLVDFSTNGGPNLYSRPAWIGLDDPVANDGGAHSADFVWSSGETNAYRNWNPGEPSNSGNNEYYTAINWHFAQGSTSTRGTWNDAPLAGSTGYGGNSDGPYYGIVEIGTGLPTLPPVAGAYYGPIFSTLNGHQYYLLPPNNWSNAQASAEALGGSLATVRSTAESLWMVTNLFIDATPYGGPNFSDVPLWIGLYDPQRNDGSGPTSQHATNFIWASGETTTYRNWNPSTSEPNNANNNEYFVAVNWHLAENETVDHTTWDDTPLAGTVGYGGNSDGPYYGIAEVIPGNPLSLGVTNGIATISLSANTTNAVIQSTTNLALPVWVPVWTNLSGTPFFIVPLNQPAQFFRLAQ